MTDRRQRINRWQASIERIVADYRQLDAACDAALRAGVLDPSGPLYDAIWRAHEGMCCELDLYGWIDWYLHENDCGEKAFSGTSGHRPAAPVRTPRQLARLIVESEDG